jgi:hypothetical protein
MILAAMSHPSDLPTRAVDDFVDRPRPPLWEVIRAHDNYFPLLQAVCKDDARKSPRRDPMNFGSAVKRDSCLAKSPSPTHKPPE